MQIIPTYKLSDYTWVEFRYLLYNFDYGVNRKEISKGNSLLKCKDEYRTPVGNTCKSYIPIDYSEVHG